MKSFSVSGAPTLSFASSIAATTTITSTIAFKHLTFMYWSFKLRVCPAGYPYFQPSTLLCLDICPNGQYGDNSSLMCMPCHYSCLTCSAFATCLTCDPAANRNLTTNACPPLLGFYDNRTAVAVSCAPQIANCIDCTNSTGTIACVTCAAGFYLDATGQCSPCDR